MSPLCHDVRARSPKALFSTVALTALFLSVVLDGVKTVSARSLVQVTSTQSGQHKSPQSQSRLVPGSTGQGKDILTDFLKEASKEGSALGEKISLSGSQEEPAAAAAGTAGEAAEAALGVAAGEPGALIAAASLVAGSGPADAATGAADEVGLAAESAAVAVGTTVAESAAERIIDATAAATGVEAEGEEGSSVPISNDIDVVWRRCVENDKLGEVCVGVYVEREEEPPVVGALITLRNHTFVTRIAGAVACVDDQLLLTLMLHDPQLKPFAHEIKAIMIAERVAAADVISECVLFNGLNITVDRSSERSSLVIAACPRLSAHLGCLHARCLYQRDHEMGCFSVRVPMHRRVEEAVG